MAFPGTNSGSNASPAVTWAFNPPPGWPAPPPGWQPPAGWQPEPGWPPAPAGWNFWVPAAAPAYGHTNPAGYAVGTAAHPAAMSFPGVPVQGGFPGQQQAARPPHPDILGTFLRTLFPVVSWLHDRGWRQWTRLMLIPYALLPLIFMIVFQNSVNPATPAWAYALYIAPLWGAGFWLLIRPGALHKREMLIALGVVVWTAIWCAFITGLINDLLGEPTSVPVAIGVGINEELTKALPILVIGLIMKASNKTLDVRMWMFLGTLSGLIFGVVEASGYAVIYTGSALSGLGHASNVSQASNVEINLILGFAERIFVDGLQHAIWAGISGFFMGIAINYRKRRWAIIPIAIAIPALLHALNDFDLGAGNGSGISQFIWILIQAAGIILFLSYTLSAHSIEERVRESAVFRGDSMVLDVSALRAQAGLGSTPGASQPGAPQPGAPQPPQPQQPPPPGWTQR